MKKFIKLLIGLLLLPLCWAFSRTVFSLLTAVPSASSAWMEWALLVGFLVSVVGFFVLPKPFRTYVLGHEMTHAVWGLLMGAKVGKMKVGKNGGHVMLSKSNFIISLAPYFFPFYTGLVILLWAVAGRFADLGAYEAGWLAIVGLTWGFHVTFTVYMLAQRQPDILENGRLFSYVVIYLANLFLVALWLIAVGQPTLKDAWSALQPEVNGVYSAVWNGAQTAWCEIRQLAGRCTQ